MPYPEVHNNYLYYRYFYRKLTTVALVLCFLVVGLLALVLFQLLSAPKPLYFATTTDGRVLPIASPYAGKN